MRVVHLVSQDSGGAGRACLRLHQALLQEGVDSIILTANKSSSIPNVLRIAQSKYQKLIEKIRPYLAQIPLMLYPKRHKDIFSPNLAFFTPSNTTLLKKLESLKPDIVHLHWIENGFISITDLKHIKAPLIWSLHDANPYTGGCHIVAAACIGVGTRCKKCPLLNARCSFDISFWTFKRKQKTYNALHNLTINGLSRWIAQCAKDSTLFKNKPIINLPNPIDTTIYTPIQKNIARELLHIDSAKKIICFGAIGATSTPRKGFSQLQLALKSLPDTLKANCILVVFGADTNITDTYGIRTFCVGILHDDISLRLLYSASDVFVTPSHLESFGQTALESLSCGTPVVAYDTSGLKDIITHKVNGYLAQCYDVNDLASGIQWVLNLDSSAYEELSLAARAQAISRFDFSKVAPSYIQAYKNAIGGGADKTLARLALAYLLSASFTKDNYPHKHTDFYIGFGAIGGSSIKRKGFYDLQLALASLDSRIQKNTKLITFGGDTKNLGDIPTISLGYMSDDTTLSLIYNACDVFIVPSLAENLSNTILESLSCGTPVVAYDIGGNADMIIHKYNGYLAKDTNDLKEGIQWIANLDSSAYEELCANARQSVIKNFSFKHVANRYIHTYKTIITPNGGGI